MSPKSQHQQMATVSVRPYPVPDLVSPGIFICHPLPLTPLSLLYSQHFFSYGYECKGMLPATSACPFISTVILYQDGAGNKYRGVFMYPVLPHSSSPPCQSIGGIGGMVGEGSLTLSPLLPPELILSGPTGVRSLNDYFS